MLRPGGTQRDGSFSPGTNPHYDSRSPSPGRPLQPYAHPDEAHSRSNLHLQMPTASHDRLAMQPTYSVENIPQSQGHNQQYEQQASTGAAGDMGYGRNDYIVSPEEH